MACSATHCCSSIESSWQLLPDLAVDSTFPADIHLLSFLWSSSTHLQENVKKYSVNFSVFLTCMCGDKNNNFTINYFFSRCTCSFRYTTCDVTAVVTRSKAAAIQHGHPYRIHSTFQSASYPSRSTIFPIIFLRSEHWLY